MFKDMKGTLIRAPAAYMGGHRFHSWSGGQLSRPRVFVIFLISSRQIGLVPKMSHGHFPSRLSQFIIHNNFAFHYHAVEKVSN